MTGIGESMSKIRKFLDEKGADEDVYRAYETVMDYIEKMMVDRIKHLIIDSMTGRSE